MSAEDMRHEAWAEGESPMIDMETVKILACELIHAWDKLGRTHKAIAAELNGLEISSSDEPGFEPWDETDIDMTLHLYEPPPLPGCKVLSARFEGGAAFRFHCPGCGHKHSFFKHHDPAKPSWEFNGDFERPTFSPSLLNTVPDAGSVCHLFVRDGRIEYLADCTHHLAGQTVAMDDATKF